MPPVSRYSLYVLGVMVGINFLNYVDRWVAAAVAPLVKAEFHLSDFQLGLLGSAFTLVYALGALPFGFWADRGLRKRVIGVGVTIWSLATFLTGFTRNYFQLFLTRAFLGIGEASYYPAGTALLGDWFPQRVRSRAMSVWSGGSVLGIAVGFAAGGLIAQRYGWRTAFFLAGVPGLVLAALAVSMREPLRGQAEATGPKVSHAEDATLKSFLNLMRIPSLRWIILAQTVLFFVLAANAFFLPTVLTRSFHVSLGTAGVVSGGVIVLGGLVGSLAGGWLADWRRRRSRSSDLEVAIAGFLVGAVTVFFAIQAPTLKLFVPGFFVSVIALYLYSGPFTAITQNVVIPSLRASAVTMSLLIAHLFGDSWATVAVGVLSDWVGDLRLALLIVSPALLLVAAGIAALGLRHLPKDLDDMQATWAARPAA